MADALGAVRMRAGRALAAGVAVAGVLLAGCTAEPDRFVPQGDAGGVSATPDLSRAPVATPTARTETVEVAPGVRLVVEWPAAPDRDTAGMVAAFRDHLAGSFRAVVTGGRDIGYLDAVTGDAVGELSTWVGEFLDQHRSVRGTARVYALTVGPVDGRGAQMEACMDESGMRLLDTATGRPLARQPAWTREPFLQAAGMRLGDDGVWRVALLRHTELPSERVKGCLR
ncbi:hypothetical protein [Streptosporangium sp. NPDC020145]|uniref:hypothetical protein n=1 Tax=Streptosporangium sp. NPDC020145 TaxID=3154694 RepID=UPI00343DFAFB